MRLFHGRFKSLQFALVFCSAQIALLWILAPPSNSIHEHYLRALNWDSVHYQNILEKGYFVPAGPLEGHHVHDYQTDIGFFPAYPICARGFQLLCRLDARDALLITAEAAALCVWWLYFLLLTGWGVGTRTQVIGAALIWIHPAAFFLVAGYTESLFIASLLGLLYFTGRWFDEKGTVNWPLAAIMGIVNSATRLVGLPLGIFASIVSWDRRKKIIPALLLTVGSASGTLAFFAYCQWKFGHWDLYLKAQSLGWGNDPNYWAVFDPRSYIPRYFFEDTVTSVSRTAVPFTAFMFGLALYYDREKRKNAAIYCVAFLVFYISLSGKINANLDSMIRYTLPSFVLLMLIVCKNFQTNLKFRSRVHPWKVSAWIGVGIALAFATEIWLASRFLRGKWAA